MSTTKNSLGTPKNFWVLVVVGLFVVNAPSKGLPGSLVALVRQLVPMVPGVVRPVDDLTLPAAYRPLNRDLAALTREEVRMLGEFYSGLARALKADPPDEPVLTTVEGIRAAHRAGLLFLWRGILNIPPDKYPSLRDSIEGVLSDAIGKADVPLSPTIKQAAIACFEQVAALCQNATR